MVVTEAHKEALAVGRKEGRIVRAYLNALSSYTETNKLRTVEVIEEDLKWINIYIDKETSVLIKLRLIQKRIDLNKELDVTINRLAFKDPFKDKEDAFVEIAASYSKRKGLSRKAWREVGVPASVLTRAGVV